MSLDSFPFFHQEIMLKPINSSPSLSHSMSLVNTSKSSKSSLLELFVPTWILAKDHEDKKFWINSKTCQILRTQPKTETQLASFRAPKFNRSIINQPFSKGSLRSNRSSFFGTSILQIFSQANSEEINVILLQASYQISFQLSYQFFTSYTIQHHHFSNTDQVELLL